MNELKEWLQSQIETASSEIKMYSDDAGKLWPNWEELVWGCRCKINAYQLTISKIERLSAK